MKSRRDAPSWVRYLLVLSALGVVALLLILPAVNVLYQAFARGAGAYLHAIGDPDTLQAVFLTSMVMTLISFFSISSRDSVLRCH